MTFDAKRIEYANEHIYVVEIELDYCSNTFGVLPCVGGVRSITTTAVSVDDFNIGDEIEGGTSGAIGDITAISGSDPTFTFEYRITNGIDFQTAAETITNNTATGVATKDANAPTLITSGDDKCFNTIETSQDLVNYTLTGVTTGEQTIGVNGAAKTFTRFTGSYITDGLKVGHTVTSENFIDSANDQTALLISALTATVMTCATATGLVTESSTGGKVITLNSTLVYRFCEERSPHPIGLDAMPFLESVNISPQVLDPRGGFGVRSFVSLQFSDHPSSDIGIDKYVDDRTWIAFERGTFWTKLRARNLNYQNRNLRVLSGYLENGVFIESNFQTRHYIIDKMDVTAGQATVTAKDPLKLASSRKAQVPAPSNGLLSAALSAGVTSATLTPTGIGSEYPASGKATVKAEVMDFTISGDDLTLVRGQNNTADVNHAQNDTFQLAYEKNAQVNIIVKDLLTNFANIDPAFIPDAAWQSEVDTFLSGLLDGIITKPRDVNKVLIELSEAMPHYLWWDERTKEINLTALKQPPSGADVLDMDENLIRDSVRVKDMTELRTSTVFVNFGQFDPTMKLDEPNNFQQTYARIDTDSIVKYESSVVKTINSRWISNLNKATALQLAALIGRRLSDIPRHISFSLDAKDADVWIGQSRSINHRDIVDPTGIPVDTVFELTSVKESENYDYTGLEFTYGDEVDSDEGAGGGDPDTDLVIISVDDQNINLRTIFDTLFPAPDASTKAKFVVENGVVIGSTSTSAALDTGSWPGGATVTLQTNAGSFIVGKGGTGSNLGAAATVGGLAIDLSFALELINNGVIGGGGGGGGGSTDGAGSDAAGGGGGGNDVGPGGSSQIPSTGSTRSGASGTIENGGLKGEANPSGPVFLEGGDGGDLGTAGDLSGAAAGIAIDKNGFTLTETETGDIRGAIVT